MVAEFAYRPTACKKSYRMIVLRKRVEVGKGQLRLFEEYRYFFYITNDRTMTAEEVVFSANDRCDQENLIAQLKGGVHALTTPVDDLVSNWAYMVMGSLAWSLKAWSALLVPIAPRHRAKHEEERRTLLRMEFATYCAAFIQMPCQLVRSGRPVDLPAAVVEPVAGGLPAAGRAAATDAGCAEGWTSEVGVRMPRSVWAIETRKTGER